MTVTDALMEAPRILISAEMMPTQGTRFAPTGFPNLGAAEYEVATSEGMRRMLFVESYQSIANRLEALAWDEGAEDLVAPLRGLPYVRVDIDERWTDSIREAHRLNSAFIIGALEEDLAKRAGIDLKKGKRKAKREPEESGEGDDDGSTGVDTRRLAAAVFYYDPNSVLHGVFLAKMVGLARLTRLLSGFIEASDASLAASGGVKNDRIDPSGKGFEGGAVEGFGNIPFARNEYTAGKITAYFSFDNALLRSYGLPESANLLLRLLGLWKIAKFLSEPRRLRSNCDLAIREQPAGLPELAEIEQELPGAIQACASEGLFANPAVTRLSFVPPKKKS